MSKKHDIYLLKISQQNPKILQRRFSLTLQLRSFLIPPSNKTKVKSSIPRFTAAPFPSPLPTHPHPPLKTRKFFLLTIHQNGINIHTLSKTTKGGIGKAGYCHPSPEAFAYEKPHSQTTDFRLGIPDRHECHSGGCAGGL